MLNVNEQCLDIFPSDIKPAEAFSVSIYSDNRWYNRLSTIFSWVKIKIYMYFLYKFFLRLKLLLFMIWDISSYIGVDNRSFINYRYNKELKVFDKKSDFNIFDFLDWDNFKVENKKEYLPFYDSENNMKFFNRLYIIVGLLPYNESPIEFRVFSSITKSIEALAHSVELRLNKSYNFTKWGRGWHCHLTSEQEQDLLLIENKIKDWIVEFLKERRDEWSCLLKTEIIESRNLRLLNEIETLLK